MEEWQKEHKDEIELFFLCPYSPEINPDEYLNHNMKQKIHSGKNHTKKQLRKRIEEVMQNLQEKKRKGC